MMKYDAEIQGPDFSQTTRVETLEDAVDLAKSLGSKVDKCLVRDRSGQLVAAYHRDRRVGWFRARVIDWQGVEVTPMDKEL